MVWLNTEHINRSVPPGTFGGAMCTCNKCRGIEEPKIDLEIPKELTSEQKMLSEALKESEHVEE